jgi:hypothetical protein
MGEGRCKTISMNDEIFPAYMVSTANKTKRPGKSERFVRNQLMAYILNTPQSRQKKILRKRNKANSKMRSLI